MDPRRWLGSDPRPARRLRIRPVPRVIPASPPGRRRFMTPILLAVCILLSVLVAVDLLLTIGIVRRLKAGASLAGGSGEPQALPRPGHRIDPRIDSVEWDEAAAAAVTGTAVLILAVSHCSACERLKRELAAHGELPLPVYVMGDPVDDPAGT